MKEKSKKIIKLVVIFIIMLCIILMVSLNKNRIISIVFNKKIQNEEEQAKGPLDFKIEIKDENETQYNCLITFASNDENNKIKKIEYPKKADEAKENNLEITNANEKEKIAIDYTIEKGKEIQTFTVEMANGEKIEEETGYTINYDANGGNIEKTVQNQIKGYNARIRENVPTKVGYSFYGWSTNKDDIVTKYSTDYLYEKTEANSVNLYAIWRKENTLTGESILKVAEDINETSQIEINANNEKYTADALVYNENVTLDGTSSLPGAILEENKYEFTKLEETTIPSEALSIYTAV